MTVTLEACIAPSGLDRCYFGQVTVFWTNLVVSTCDTLWCDITRVCEQGRCDTSSQGLLKVDDSSKGAQVYSSFVVRSKSDKTLARKMNFLVSFSF